MRAAILLATLSTCLGTEPQPEPTQATQSSWLEVQGAWVRAVPPGTPNSAAFFTVINRGPSMAEIVGASSEAARGVELHTHEQVDGQARMRQVERLQVPGKGHHHLAPGGDHVMLLGLREPLDSQGVVALELSLSDGSSVQVKAPVRSAPPQTEHDHGGPPGHEHPAHE